MSALWPRIRPRRVVPSLLSQSHQEESFRREGKAAASRTSAVVRRQFVRDALVQVIGTVVGGLLLLGCLKLGGIFGEVEWASVGKAVLFGLIAAYALLRVGIKFAEGALTLHLLKGKFKGSPGVPD